MRVAPTFGSLFSGIGGLDLGLERAGWRAAWQSEIEPYCCRVLAKQWPDVPNLGDVTTIDWSSVGKVDLICGGYPCQPFSLAGARRGADDERHLWPHMRDALGVLRPRLALLENVPGHLSMGFGDVLGDLADLGYDAEWDCIPAAAVGAPHLRYRVFVVAHARSEQYEGDRASIGGSPAAIVPAHPDREGESGQPLYAEPRPRELVPDPEGSGWDERRDGDGQSARRLSLAPGGGGRFLGNSDLSSEDALAAARRSWGPAGESGQWAVEPDVGRVAHGIPARVDRLRALGNAVVPQVAQWIGERLLACA